MQDKDPTGLVINWLAILVSTAFATVGGVVKHLSDSQEMGRDATFQGTVIQGITGGFSGCLATMYTLEKDLSFYVVLGIAGLAGFGGAATLRFMLKAIYRYIGSTHNGRNDFK